MSVAFVQTVPFWPTPSPAASPQTSVSFTPTAGNFLLGINNDDSTNGSVLTLNGSANNLTLGQNQNDAGNANTAAIFGLNAISGGAQTLTVARTGGGNFLYGAAFEFSGVDTPSYTSNIPASVASVTLGTSVSVPVGGILVAWIKFDSGAGNAITAQADAVSSIAANALISGNVGSNYCAAYWVGAGTNIQPKFLEAGGGANNGILLQALLPPAAASGPSQARLHHILRALHAA